MLTDTTFFRYQSKRAAPLRSATTRSLRRGHLREGRAPPYVRNEEPNRKVGSVWFSTFVKLLNLLKMFGIDDAILASLAVPVISSIVGNVGAKNRQDAMNAYNSPVQQMQRYAQAGLNPNLIYSQGTPGNQASPTAFFTPEVDPVKVWSAATQAKESRMRRQSLYWKSKAQELLGDYQAAKNSALIPRMDLNAHYQSNIMKYQIHKSASQVRNLDQLFENLKKDSAIKSNVLNEKEYYNQLRDYGVEKGDNPFYRMGTLMFRKYIPKFR